MDLSAETLQARREWQNIFKVLKGKKKNELKEMKTISETSRTIWNAPTFELYKSHQKKTKRKTMRKYLRR